MTLTEVLLDIASISTLMFIAFLIRQRIPFFQKYYIPTSLIAGILGLLLGPQVLGQFSPVSLNFSGSISQWTNFLLAFVFTTSFLGTASTKFGRDVAAATCITGAVFMAQILLGLAAAFVLGMVMSGVPYEMGLLPVSGFYGGHGSAGIMGGVFQTEGWAEASGIALTYATVGMFAAVIGGMWIINWGAKKGYSKRKMSGNYLEKKDMTGIIPKEDRKPMAMTIANSSVLDPMAFQLAIVGTIIAVSHVLREAIIKVLPFWSNIQLYTMCLIIGAIVGIGLSKTKYNQYIDRGSMKAISGAAHRRDDPDLIADGRPAVCPLIAHKGLGLKRLGELHLRVIGVLHLAGKVRRHVVGVHPLSGRNVLCGVPDGEAVLDDHRILFDGLKSHFMTLGNVFSRRNAFKFRALFYGAERHGHVVFLMNMNKIRHILLPHLCRLQAGCKRL